MKKRLLSILLAAVLAAALLPAASFAADDKFASAFFPDGRISKPAAAPFIHYFNDEYDEVNGDFLYGYFELPEDIRKLNETMAKSEDITAFDAAYGTDYGYTLCLQLDSKLDDGPWQYTGAWDTATYSGDMGVGANEYALGYLLSIYGDATEKILTWDRFSALASLDPDNIGDGAGWAKDGIYAADNHYGSVVCHFDFANHTFSYRYRYIIKYTPAGADTRYLLSDWSDVTSIGKNGTQKPLTAHDAQEAPVLSEFKVNTEKGDIYAEFYMDIPRDYYIGQIYHNAYVGNDDAYRIHAEVKVNGADWQEVEIGNSTWLKNGYRSIFYSEFGIKADDSVQIRTRVQELMTGRYSPYSNVIGTKAFEASSWALPYMQQADELGLIPDCLVGQDLTGQITRREFAAVAVKIYESLSGEAAAPVAVNPFTDCNDTEVLKGCSIGITNGTAADKFSPDEILNREQLATMLTRIYKKVALDGWTLAADGEFNAEFKTMFTMPAPFADDASISAWAKDSVYFMKAQGIIDGVGDNMFAPKHGMSANEAASYGLATREQALKIAVGMVQNLK